MENKMLPMVNPKHNSGVTWIKPERLDEYTDWGYVPALEFYRQQADHCATMVEQLEKEIDKRARNE